MTISLHINADTPSEFVENLNAIATQVLAVGAMRAQQQGTVDPTATATEQTAAPAEPEKPKRKRKTKAEKEAEAAAAAAEQTTEEPKSEPEPEQPASEDAPEEAEAIDRALIKQELVELVSLDDVKGPEFALAILEEYGVKKVNEIDEEHWPDLLSKIGEAKAKIAKA